MSILADEQIGLSDGRRLGYAEFGAPDGLPLFYFHGFPGSRLEAALAGASAEALRIRIIAVDRPGYGRSDFKPGRLIRDWPDDVAELADALSLDRFAVGGASGGGPYVAACAAKIPQRLTAAGILCGLGPLDAPGAMDGMAPLNRNALRLARRSRWFVRAVMAVGGRFARRHPQTLLARIMATSPEPDRIVLQRTALRRILIETFVEAFRSGSRGPAWEVVLYGRPWGFDLTGIPIQVWLWQGEADTIVPPAMARYLAGVIPDCRATYYANEAHFSLIVNRMQDMLGRLVESPTASRSRQDA